MKITARPSDEHERLAEFIATSLLQGNEEYKSLKIEIKNVVAYFLRYTYIPLAKTDEEDKALDNAIKVFISAPWIGIEDGIYVAAFKFLIEKSFILLTLDVDQYKIFMNGNFNCGDEQHTFEKFIDDAEHEKKSRDCYVEVSDNTGNMELRTAIENKLSFNKDKKLTLKIIAYHGKTWLETDKWINSIVNEHKNLKVKILIVGKNPALKVREGADKRTHKNSIKNGFRELAKLYWFTKLRVDVRFYGDKNKYSYLRGAIIEEANHDICYCNITCWRMGEERGNYGKNIRIHNDVNLAYIVNNYFDTVFRKARCVGPKFRKAWGVLKTRMYWILSFVVIAAIFAVKSICEVFIPNGIVDIVIDGMYALIVFVLGVVVPIILTEYIELHKDR